MGRSQLGMNGNRRSLDQQLTVIEEGIRHVHVRITAAIAVAAVLAPQIPLGASSEVSRVGHGC